MDNNTNGQEISYAFKRAPGPSLQDPEAMTPVQRTPTMRDPSPIIEQYVTNYKRSVEHWQKCAEQAQRLIEEQLAHEECRDENGEAIFARVTSRAKSPDSLLEKLKLRNVRRQIEDGKVAYRDTTEIDEDLVDLAGVRVTLYTPNSAQRKQVREVIYGIWGKENVALKEHGDPDTVKESKDAKDPKDASSKPTRAYVRRHIGYQAEHYRVPMLKQHAAWGVYRYELGDRVEIQVVSALGHASFEAGHDVLYKTHANGRPSEMEVRILDALNGLVSSGEILLEQFRQSVTKRTVGRWALVDDFRFFLRDFDMLEHQDAENSTVDRWDHFSEQSTDILFRFLKKIGMNYGTAVRTEMGDLGYPEAPYQGLKDEWSKYRPAFHIDDHLKTTFCIISRHLPVREKSDTPTSSRQCSVMLDALILIQTFAGSPREAWDYLNNPNIHLTAAEANGLNFVIVDPLLEGCLDGDNFEFNADELTAAWKWFDKQADNTTSLCGLFFRMAEMDIPAQELDNASRLTRLTLDRLNLPTSPLKAPTSPLEATACQGKAASSNQA